MCEVSILCFLPLRQAELWLMKMKVRTYRLILMLTLHKDLRYIHTFVLVIEIFLIIIFVPRHA